MFPLAISLHTSTGESDKMQLPFENQLNDKSTGAHRNKTRKNKNI
jgi:hypothetical protein